MEDIASWERYVTPYVPNVAYKAFEDAVRDAAIEFCEKTYIWKVDSDRLDVVADTQTVLLSTSDADAGSADPFAVDNVKYKQDGEDDDQFTNLDPISEEQSDAHRSSAWKFETATTPNGYWLGEDLLLYFYEIPTEDSTGGLLVKMVMKPNKTCTELPSFLYDNWHDAIASGAKAILLAQNAQPWYNPEAAGVWAAAFNLKLDDAKWVKYHGRNKRTSRVRMRKWI